MQQAILDKLVADHKGAKRAIMAHDLALSLSRQSGHFISERQVREAISEMRIAGEPIASSCGNGAGFYIPETAEEARATIESMRHRAKVVCMAAAGVERGLTEMFGDQLALPLEAGQ